jgi:hypothetical protein
VVITVLFAFILKVLWRQVIPIDSVLKLDTARRLWHGREAFGADRRFAVGANSKLTFVDPS